jgi:hypothetical protein
VRRILIVLTVALVMIAMSVGAAMPAFAVGGPNSPGNSGHLKSGPGRGGPGPGGVNDHQTQQCTENLGQLNKPCVAVLRNK